MEFIKLTLLVAFLAVSSLAQDQYVGTNYNTGDSGRSEQVLPDGTVQGQYSYTDPNGKLITVKYRAGKEGFQVEGDHLPQAPQPQQAPAQQQPQQQQYNNYQQQQPQYNNYQQPQSQQPQFNNYQQQQPLQQYNNNLDYQQSPQPQQYNSNNYQQPQQTPTIPASTFFSNNGQQPQGFGAPVSQGLNNFQQPNTIQQQRQSYNPFGQQPTTQGQQNNYINSNGGRSENSAKVSVSQQPGQGFSYTYET